MRSSDAILITEIHPPYYLGNIQFDYLGVAGAAESSSYEANGAERTYEKTFSCPFCDKYEEGCVFTAKDFWPATASEPQGFDITKTFIVWCDDRHASVSVADLPTFNKAEEGTFAVVDYTLTRPRIRGARKFNFYALSVLTKDNKNLHLIDRSGPVPKPVAAVCPEDKFRFKIGDKIIVPNLSTFRQESNSEASSTSPKDFVAFFCNTEVGFPVIELKNPELKTNVGTSVSKQLIRGIIGGPFLLNFVPKKQVLV